jgi:hypothetical protein
MRIAETHGQFLLKEQGAMEVKEKTITRYGAWHEL